MALSFRGLFRKMIPWWLLAGDGEKVHFSFALLADAAAERLRQGIRARFPSDAPSDALAHIGRDRLIVRGFDETDAHYRSRLPTWLGAHKRRGNPYALLEQILEYLGYAEGGMKVRTVDNRGNWYTIESDATRPLPSLQGGNWNWDGEPATKWSRFWTILYPPAELWVATPLLGDPELWGGAIGNSGYTIGSTATLAQVQTIKALVNFWKPEGTRCIRIVVAFDSDDFDPVDGMPPNPDGDWDIPTNRNLDARYWNPNS